MSVHPGPDPAVEGLGRRRLLAYLVAAPALTMVVKWSDVLDVNPAAPAGASPAPADVFDLTDALTLAALPTAYLLHIEVTQANRVVVGVPRAEVGQGITTALAVIAAEELGARLADVDAVLEDARPELLFNQLTGGSNSVHALYEPVRTVAAATRARLITAAAQRWGVPAGTLTTRDTSVVAPDGRSATFGSLSAAAAAVAVPSVPGVPKDPSQFTLIGRPHRRIDARAIVTGQADYSLDVPVPGAKPTVVARPPTIRGTVASVDAAAARRVPGVLAVTRIPTGVAVTADTFHQAQRGRNALRITWNPGPNAGLSDQQVFAALRAATPPFTIPSIGSASINRTFEFAFAPHAPLEVWNCVADVRADRAELWCASKSPIVASQKVADAVGLPAGKVTFHVIRGGGSFGHRLFWDPAIEAAQVSKAIGRPVRLMWTRNDDMRHGRMRPASHHKVRVTHLLGAILTYEHRMATLPVDFSHGLGDALTAVGFELGSGTATQGVFALSQKVPYDVGVATQLMADVRFDLPTSSWRSIYSGQVAVANEVMVDEVARALGQDPVAFRRQRLRSSRAKAVLDRIASAGRWGRSMPAGTAQGVALWEEYKSVVGYLVEIDTRGAEPRVTKGVCAVDVGTAVNPRGLEAQMQGALVDGLSMTLQAGLHLEGGAIREGSYADYHFARIRHAPRTTEVHDLSSGGAPGGAGELGFPAAAAAVANAWARATGRVPNRFPIAG
jgi:isoquinoline 1-oxidoreductase beta subunit